MIRILFLIRSLEYGGAERQLVELVKELDKKHFEIIVVTAYDTGILRQEIDRLAGVTVYSLHRKGLSDLFGSFWRLVRIVRSIRPDIVHGYMGVSNEFALLAARSVRARVVWGVRASNMDLLYFGWKARLSFLIGSMLSRFPDLIIINSEAGKKYHIAHGYKPDRMIVIPNGIDTLRFRPNRDAGQQLRSEWGIGQNELLIGLVGRLDPMKDHPTFLRAAALLARQRDDVKFVCVGSGSASYKNQLIEVIRELGITERVLWVEARADIENVYNALNIATSSSSGEGFSNVIGEAMACEVNCVVTDVGDSAALVGNRDQIVPVRDPQALMVAWLSLLNAPHDEQEARRRGSRERILNNYSVQHLVASTEAILNYMLSCGSIPSPIPSSNHHG